MSKTSAAPWNATGFGAPAMDTAQQFAASMARLQAHAAKAVIDYNLEAVDFVKHRLQRDADFVTRMAASKDMIEAVELYSDFWQKAFAEYTSETGKLAALNTKTARSAAAELAQQTGAKGQPAHPQVA